MNKLAINGGVPSGRVELPKWPIFSEKEVESVSSVIRSGKWDFIGPKEQEFEKKFASFCGSKYGVAVTNGTHALRVSLEALGIGPGDEVIVPGLTWQATAASVIDVNAVPVLVDISPEDYNIDPDLIEAAVTSRTKCIIPVHLYGRVCNMDRIMQIAAKYGLLVLEDCSHQHGSEWKNKKVGTFGNIGSFSLQGGKILTTGEGGIIVTDDERINTLLHSLKNCGRPYYENAAAMHSGNFRMTEFQAAIGVCQLERLEEQSNTRETNANYIENALKDVAGLEFLGKNPNVTKQAYYMMTLKYNPREWNNAPKEAFIKAVSAEIGIDNWVYLIYEPLNNCVLFRPLSKMTYKVSQQYSELINPERFNLPVCAKAYEEAFCLPQYLLLAERKEIDKFIDAIVKIKENKDELKG